MKKKNTAFLIFIAASMLVACANNRADLTTDEIAQTKDSVQVMMANVAGDLAKKSPAVWVNYFENSACFYMANGGEVVFKDYPSAKTFILTVLVKNMPGIKLRWDNIRVEPLTGGLATVGAGFHEDQTFANGKTSADDGYMTGTVHYDGQRWKFKNLHWSEKPGK